MGTTVLLCLCGIDDLSSAMQQQYARQAENIALCCYGVLLSAFQLLYCSRSTKDKGQDENTYYPPVLPRY